MGVVLALPKLYDDVVARFASDAAAQVPPVTPVPNVFGWQTPARQEPTGPRIAWVPGDPNGGLGALGPASQPGRNPRSLGTLSELFTVVIRSADDASPTNERAQYQIVRELFDAWWRACYLAARGRVAIQSSEWITEKLERRHGAALRVVCTVQAMIPDTVYETAPIDARAEIDDSLLDVTETVFAQNLEGLSTQSGLLLSTQGGWGLAIQ